MGIKGTVRRSTDGDFIHANVDIDLIITEEPEMGNVEKPVEIFHIIEHFCLGRRRLHLFGRDSTIRPGKGVEGGGRAGGQARMSGSWGLLHTTCSNIIYISTLSSPCSPPPTVSPQAG